MKHQTNSPKSFRWKLVSNYPFGKEIDMQAIRVTLETIDIIGETGIVHLDDLAEMKNTAKSGDYYFMRGDENSEDTFGWMLVPIKDFESAYKFDASKIDTEFVHLTRCETTFTAIEIKSRDVIEMLNVFDKTLLDVFNYDTDLHGNFLVLDYPVKGEWAVVTAERFLMRFDFMRNRDGLQVRLLTFVSRKPLLSI